MRLLVLVLAAAALTVGPAQATSAACDQARGRAAIASTHLRMTPLGGATTRVDPNSADRVLCHDFTRDGRVDLAVTLASGGTAGDVVSGSGSAGGVAVAARVQEQLAQSVGERPDVRLGEDRAVVPG